jgi:glutamate racemase
VKSSSGESNNSALPIGVFDSGLGGLRVLDRLLQAFPNERFVYLGDTQHMPYGHKSDAEVCQAVSACLAWLFHYQPVKLMVVACNTAAATAADCFKPYAPVPFVDPVSAMCGWLAEKNSYRRLGLMATPATVASDRYRTLLDGLGAQEIGIQAIACEHLASVIEAGEVDTLACRALLEKYLAPLRASAVEAIILGCTHYPYAHTQIAELAPEAEILDPDIYMVRQIAGLLPLVGATRELKGSATSSTGNLRQKPGRNSPTLLSPAEARVEYYVTQAPERFYKAGQQMPFQAIAMQLPQLAQPNFEAGRTII